MRGGRVAGKSGRDEVNRNTSIFQGQRHALWRAGCGGSRLTLGEESLLIENGDGIEEEQARQEQVREVEPHRFLSPQHRSRPQI